MIFLKAFLVVVLYKIILYIIVYYLFRNVGLRIRLVENGARMIYSRQEADILIPAFFKKFHSRWCQKTLFFLSEFALLVFAIYNFRDRLKLILPIDITKEFNSESKKHRIKFGKTKVSYYKTI